MLNKFDQFREMTHRGLWVLLGLPVVMIAWTYDSKMSLQQYNVYNNMQYIATCNVVMCNI